MVFLGTAAAVPTKDRGLSCMCIEREGEVLMFDAGEGTQVAFSRAALGWNRSMAIFITHMHGDHCLGLPGLIQTMSLQSRSRPVRIYGPKGISDFVRMNMSMLSFKPPFVVEVREVAEGVILETDGYLVRSCEADHTVPAYSYLLEERERPGRFHPEKARELGVPEGRMWGLLQKGRDVEVDGRAVRPGQVLGESRPGVRIGYSGDTRPTKRLEAFFAGCDYLVFDSTFTEDMKERADATRHSTAGDAATLAKNGGVRNLILTHFSARYGDDAVPLAEARSIHGSVIAAKDLMSMEVS